MNNVSKDLAVQSWCLRHFKTTAQVIEQVKAIGLSRIELCDVHADFNDESKHDTIIEDYMNAGIKIVSIGIQGFRGNEAIEERWFKFVKKAGAKRIGVSIGLDNHMNTIKMIDKLAEKYDVYAGIHNHGGYDWLGSRGALNYVFKNSSKRLGLEMDAAWCMQAGEKPIQMAEQFINRLYGVHLKDFTFERNGRWNDVVTGTGTLDLKALIELVQTKAPDGCNPIIEYEADEQNPGPALTKCVESVRSIK